MNENYIMLNGKRVDLTDEQLEKLGLKVEKKDYFERRLRQHYYAIDVEGGVFETCDTQFPCDYDRFAIANYCTDKSLMEQRALHETLSRLLWRFSMQNDGDKIDWTDFGKAKYYIVFDTVPNKFEVSYVYRSKCSEPYFISPDIAKRAIKEIILPFIEKYPEFVW